MKKLIFTFAIVATLAVALLSTGHVFAQGTTPPAPQTPGSGYGYGRGMGVEWATVGQWPAPVRAFCTMG